MALHRPRTLALLLLLVLAAVALPTVAPTTAAPPPESVAGLCTEDALDGGVEDCEVTIHIQEDGSANWTVRADLDAGTATELRDDADDRRDRVREELTRRTVVDEVADLETRIENRSLVVTFTSADFAHRGVGVVVADGLFPSTQNAQVSVEATRLAVHGPAGTVPTLVPDTATAADGAILWTEPADLGSETYLAFGAGGLLSSAAAHVAVGVEQVGRILPGLLPVVALPTLLVAGVLAGLLGYGDRLRSDGHDEDLATRVGLGGGVAVPILLAVGVGAFLLGANASGGVFRTSLYFGISLVSLVPGTLVAAGLAATLALWGDRIRLDRYAWWVFPAASICWLVVVGSTGPNRLLGTWTTTVVVFLLLGAAHERGTLAALPVALVALLTPTLAAGPILYSFVPSSVLVLWTVGTLVTGIALYVLGRQESTRPGLSESPETEKSTTETA